MSDLPSHSGLFQCPICSEHWYVLFVSQSSESLVCVLVSQSHYTMTAPVCPPYLLGYGATEEYQPLTLVTSTRPFRGTTLTSSMVRSLLAHL